MARVNTKEIINKDGRVERRGPAQPSVEPNVWGRSGDH
jgi:hypothetical protein